MSCGPAAAQELKPGNSADAEAKSPEQQQAAFRLAPGFQIELVASEETGLPKPVSVAFDDSGRMWAVTATEYPRDQDPEVWKSPGRDRVVIFDTPLAPGPHTARTFADGLVMPLSVLPHRNGAIVAQGPEILFLEDSNGDGRADRRRVLLRGFGVQDTHTLPHQLEPLPGNWVVFSQGVLNSGTAVTSTGTQVNFDKTVIARFRPDGSELEILGTGLNNIWAWVQDRNGRVFFHEANDLGYSLVPFERDTSYPSFIKRLVHPDAPFHPPTAPHLSLGGTGFSGLALSDDRSGSFPPPWKDVFFVANPITRKINTVAASLDTNGVFTFRQLPDLVTSEDEFFRPVALRFGPDGCLYVVDWYNPIISHNEVDRNHPARDKTRGRVWRVRHESQTRRSAPDVAAAPNAALLRHLQAPGTWEMRAAWHQIVERGARELVPGLITMIRDPATPDDVRIHAVWCLEGLGVYDPGLWRELLASGNPDVRHEAVRALSSLRPPAESVFDLLQPLTDEPAFRVRHEIIRFFRDCPEPVSDAQRAWLARWRTDPDLTQTVKGWERDYLAPGGVYESAFQNLLLQMVDEKEQPRFPSPVSTRWSQVLGQRPPRSAEDQERLSDRLRNLLKAVTSEAASDGARGRQLFEERCAGCHAITGDGRGFGPSLSGSQNRTPEAVLTAILDPGQAIEGVFRIYRVETVGGDVFEGFFGEETPEALTLRFAGGTQEVIPVQDIRAAGYVDGLSVMPEGLLDSLSDQEAVDLVRYVLSLP